MKIVFLCGHVEDLSDLKEIGEEDISIIFKPVPIDEILRKVRTILDS